MCGCRVLISILIIFSVVIENQAGNSKENEDDNSNNPVIYGCDEKILKDLIPTLELVKSTNKIIDLKLQGMEAKFEKLENTDHRELISNFDERLEEIISKAIEVKLQTFVNDFFKPSSESNSNNRPNTFIEKITEIFTESVQKIDLKLNTIVDDLLAIKTKSESSEKFCNQQIGGNLANHENNVLVSLQKQMEKIQTNVNQQGLKENCAETLAYDQSSSGIYKLRVPGVELFDVYCVQDREDKHSPAWTVIQRRQNGDVDFYRNWTEYKDGFGNLENDFWLGLDKIHSMTSRQQHELLIDLEDWEGQKRVARYDNFAISNERDRFRLNLGKYSGNAGDSFSWHNNMKFTTKDLDNDPHPQNGAQLYKGGWWYNAGHHSNINGLYNSTGLAEGVNWLHWHGHYYSLKYVQMAIRPKKFN